MKVSSFGKLFSWGVDGDIYAQPLYLSDVAVPGHGRRNLVYVATEHNSVYAFDGDAQTQPIWKVNLGSAVPSEDICQVLDGASSCQYTDLVPEIGITSTPVIDTTSGTLYVVTKNKTGNEYEFVLHALDIATGAEKFGGPVQVTASAQGSGAGSKGGTLSFDPLLHLNRPGLLLLNGVVYIAFGAVGDVPPFHGWVMGYDATTLQQVAVFNASPDGEGAGIWASGQGLAAEGDSIFLATGNGTFDGNSSGRDWGSSFLRLNASQGLAVADYFTPHEQGYLTSADLDVGGSGPMLLPDMDLVLGVGKDGVLRMMQKGQFGKYNAAFNNDVQEFQPFRFFLGAPVFWNGPHGPAIYLWGVGGSLTQYGIAGGNLETRPLSQSSTSAADISDSVPLSLSANGAEQGSGIVWATAALSQGSGGGNLAGILRAFDADDLSVELWNSKQNAQRDELGNYAKFAPPTIANGKVYVPTFSGQLVVYGLTSGDFSLKTDDKVELGIGQSAKATVQVIPQGDGLTSPVALSCSGLPPGLSCRFSPSSLPAGSKPMQTTLTVTTDSTSATNRSFPKSFPATGFLLVGWFVSAAPLTGKRWRRAVLLVLFGLAATGLLTGFGCGGGATSPPLGGPVSALPSSSKFVVAATSAGIEHRRTISLLVH
ncbi:MAG TPA: hypothetical protein VL177_03255 [Terriglobales bacterium]|nr:hypothetical protein [Terriglobales bacterium]